jgi:16S rRNA (cytosine967-C5)-methyltransferase
MSTLRWQSALDARIARHCTRPLAKLDVEVLIALRLAAVQLFHLDRIPSHAAVDESVELVKRSGKRSAAGMANAILRKLAAEAGSARSSSDETAAPPDISAEIAAASSAPKKAVKIQETPDSLAATYSHPEWLVRRWIDMYGYTEACAICQAGQMAPRPALRMLSADSLAIEAELAQEGVYLAPSVLLRSARRLLSGELVKTLAVRSGRVAIQDEASQLVALLAGGGENILDCCAAPGGKTLAMAANNPQAKITAVELHPHRAEALKQRLRNMDAELASRITVLTGDFATLPFDQRFDLILADVPCSGTGTLARNPEIRWRLRESNLPSLAELQLSILRRAASLLAPGGRLVYSTCSFEPEEGESVVDELLRGTEGLCLLDCGERLAELKLSGELTWPQPENLLHGKFLRTRPGLHLCEGFFAALIECKV